MILPKVAVLFARKDSIYKTIPECEAYDIERDAVTYRKSGLTLPIIAHPPCRSWSRLKYFAKPRRGEKKLAIWSVGMIRKFGGVLEHPSDSSLWKQLNLPKGQQRDEFGGWTLSVDQFWWGHLARKRTWLYIVGVEPKDIPPIPLKMGDAEFVVSTSIRAGKKRAEIPKQKGSVHLCNSQSG